MNISRKKYTICIWVGLAVLTALSAFLHFYRLSDSPLRSDTIDFYKILKQGVSPSTIFADWFKLIGLAGQFPFPMAATKFLIDVLNLPIDHFSLRLSSALFGIACVPAAYFLGKDLYGPRGGLLVACLTAMNPILLQATREAYHYPPLILGAFLAMDAMILALNRALYSRFVSMTRYTLTAALGFFLLTWSQPTGWTLAVLFCLTLGGCEGWVMYKRRQFTAIPLFVLILVIGLPLVFADWGLSQMREVTSKAHTANTRKIFMADYSHAATYLGEATASFSWGLSWVRIGFLGLIGALSIAGFYHRGRVRKLILFIPILYVVGYVLFTLSAMRAQTPLSLRYMYVLSPAVFIMLAMGFMAPLRVPRIKVMLGRYRHYLSIALILSGMLLLVKPLKATTALEGKEKPYLAIQKWFNSNLPKGTLVLVDRWFEPWNELRVYDSTNVFYTWTIPNEPLETFLQYNWRRTAEQFFQQNPGSAYLEIHKSYWPQPGVGPWEWPRNYFSQHLVISNSPYVYLSDIGLINRTRARPPYYAGAVVEIFYDTKDDVIRKAQSTMQPLFLYGPEWGYEKMMQPPFIGFRAMEGEASINLYNFYPGVMNYELHINGVAEKSSKSVSSSTGHAFTFVPMQPSKWVIPIQNMPPGITTVSFQDPWWSSASSRLLAFDVRLIPVEASPGQPSSEHGAP